MLTRLDNLVILVGDLDRAVRDYAGLGFSLMPGGEHTDGLTRNALIPFRDGSYLELGALVDREDPRDNVWGWRPFLPSGGGLIDSCVASDDLPDDSRRLEERRFGVDSPKNGGRRLPDGTQIRWRVARIRQDGRLLPFLIEDVTPRSLRVPGGSRAEHPNGATGIGARRGRYWEGDEGPVGPDRGPGRHRSAAGRLRALPGVAWGRGGASPRLLGSRPLAVERATGASARTARPQTAPRPRIRLFGRGAEA